VNKLGNLTLISKRLNSKAQNASIDQKLPEFANSELAITKQLVELLQDLKGEWGEEQIAKRQDELADLAYDHIWAL
jgi:Protein of unknown function (DUF1524)